MTLIDIQKRSATVLVEKSALLYSFGNRELYRLYQEDVPGYVMVLQNICRELSRRLRTTNKRITEMAAESDDESTRSPRRWWRAESSRVRSTLPMIRPAVKRPPIP